MAKKTPWHKHVYRTYRKLRNLRLRNPFFIRSGDDGVHLLPAKRVATPEPNAPGTDKTVSIIIPIHNALKDVRECLISLSGTLYRPVEVILIDDGSGEATRDLVRQYAFENPHVRAVRNDEALGYTKAANQGLRLARGDYLILLNSDTILTTGWLEKMIQCAESDPTIGLVGPLSNAASYQTVPELTDTDGDWKINTLPKHWTTEDMAIAVEKARAQPSYPRLAILNGFCTLIKREVIDAIGYLDEVLFPRGYGEENDFCLRAGRAGFDLAVCDNAYIFHAKSKSFTPEMRKRLNEETGNVNVEKYGKEYLKKISKEMLRSPELLAVRESIAQAIKQNFPHPESWQAQSGFRVLFLLPVKGSSGGAHSVIQEARGMRELGVFSQVAIPSRYREVYNLNYADYPEELFFFYQSDSALEAYASSFKIVVATIFVSIRTLKQLHERYPRILPAYYIQDYEPWFEPVGSELHHEARESYAQIPDILAFAKTDWIRNQVETNHGIPVEKVSPSLDHRIYYPSFRRQADDSVVISAMVRPKTPRRNALLTMQILKAVRKRFGDGVTIEIFGVEPGDPGLKPLETDFAFVNHGICTQRRVAEILRRSDIFVDFSSYQAFGRTGLEAMACGCAVIVPKAGGASEYAVDEENCLMIDTALVDSLQAGLERLVEDSALRGSLQQAGIRTAAQYSIHKASLSELMLFQRRLSAARRG
ncbi:MAG: glycosyltransferase [Opitutales bacterium]